MILSKMFARGAIMAASLALLSACAAQPSAPTIFGSRILAPEIAGSGGTEHMASANDLPPSVFGVPTGLPKRDMAVANLAATPHQMPPM